MCECEVREYDCSVEYVTIKCESGMCECEVWGYEYSVECVSVKCESDMTWLHYCYCCSHYTKTSGLCT